MSDPTQFIVISLATVHKLLQHQGIIGQGQQIMTGNICSLHSYTDQFNRKYVMQLFESVEVQRISTKLSNIARFSHSSFLSNIVRPAFIATRKHKTAFQLAIFYDVTGIGELSLSKLFQARKNSSQKFQTQEIQSFFWQIADFLFLSIRNSIQYLNLNPLNILCKLDGYYGYNFFITNFSKSSQKSSKKIYHNPVDKFYRGQKTAQNAMSAAIFIFGMILLEMCCLLPTQQLYEDGKINEKALNKRIQGIAITNDQMISKAIKRMLQTDQQKRLKISDIFQTDQWLKMRKVFYYPSKKDFFEYRNFQGISEYDKKTSIGEAMDNQLRMLRGTFINGVFQGLNVRQFQDTLQMGIFVEGKLVQGQVIKKNSYIDIGKFKQGQMVQGIRIALNVQSINKNDKTLSSFMGDFQAGQPKKGRFIYSDNSEQIK